MATVYSLVCENGSDGSYWTNLDTAGRLRYGPAGSERVFGKLVDAITDAANTSTALDVWIIELGDAFFEDGTVSASFSAISAAKVTVTSMINGSRTAAFHYGNLNDTSGGYVFRATNYGGGLLVDRSNVTVDGFKNSSTHYATDSCLRITKALCHINAMIAFQSHDDRAPFWLGGSTSVISNCISVNNALAATTDKHLFHFDRYSGEDEYVINCIALGMGSPNVVGFYANTQSSSFAIIGCAAYGCGLGWDTANKPSAPIRQSCNAGETGETPWDTEGTSIVGITSADFVNAAGNDFRLASGSLMIGASEENFFAEPKDILDAVRPNYNPSGEQNWDIGPFEFDHGNGLAPQIVQISITGIADGSELAIYKTSDSSVIVAPTTIGASGEYSEDYTYTADVSVTVIVRKGSSGTKYRPYTGLGTITTNGLSMVVSQVEDTIAV